MRKEKDMSCCPICAPPLSRTTQTLILCRTAAVQRVNKTVEKLQIPAVAQSLSAGRARKRNYLGINKNLPTYCTFTVHFIFIFVCVVVCWVCVFFVDYCKEFFVDYCKAYYRRHGLVCWNPGSSIEEGRFFWSLKNQNAIVFEVKC